MDELKRNGSGYIDPTAYEALKNVENAQNRIEKLMKAIFCMCDLAGFHLEERLVLKDKKTGDIYR